MTLKLMLAGKRADPAIQAAEGPIGAWAAGVWSEHQRPGARESLAAHDPGGGPDLGKGSRADKSNVGNIKEDWMANSTVAFLHH